MEGKENSRTFKGIRNGQYAVLFYIATLVLGFFSRKAFIDTIGAEVLGLNSTAMNLLGFLNIAELGIGAAVAFSLYRPLAENNTQIIREIVTVQGQLYRMIAFFIMIGASGLMLLFPRIFSDISFPMWYTYATFSAYLYSSLLTYFVNYKQIVLTANQEEYKIMYSYKSVILLQSLSQIIALYSFDNGYVWWLGIQVVFSTLASISLNYIIKRDYGYLNKSCYGIKELFRKHSIIIKKTKQLFFHKIGGFVLEQSSPLIIFAYTSLTMVAIYSNYLLITNGISILFSSVCNSINAGIGNLVAEGNKNKILEVFEELFVARFFFIGISIYCIYILSPSFVSLWVGSQYVLSNSTLIIMLAILIISLLRSTVDGFINAYGAYQDIYAPVIEAITSLGISIGLGYHYGINGVLLGMFISQFLVIFLWKPFFLFKYAMKESIIIYAVFVTKSFIAFILSTFLCNLILSHIMLLDSNSIFNWLINAAVTFLVIATILFTLLFLLSHGMRTFTKRLYRLIHS